MQGSMGKRVYSSWTVNATTMDIDDLVSFLSLYPFIKLETIGFIDIQKI